jgi:hypothetical protein
MTVTAIEVAALVAHGQQPPRPAHAATMSLTAPRSTVIVRLLT